MYHSIVCLVFLMVATTGQAAGKSRVESRFGAAVKQAVDAATSRKYRKVLVVSRVATTSDAKHQRLESLAALLKHRVYHACREGKLEPQVSDDADELVAGVRSAARLANREIQRLKALAGADAVLVVDHEILRKHVEDFTTSR